MAVTSRDLAPESERIRRHPIWPLGVVAIVVGLVLWPLGAKYTLEGWITGLNLLIGLIGLPFRVPVPNGWWVLLSIIPGGLYSLVETRVRPGPPPSWAALPAWALAIVLVLLVHGSDIASTFLGYLFPADTAWALHKWAASDGLWFLVVWSLILTYLPERSLIYGHRWIGSPLEKLWTSWRKSGQNT